MRMRFRHRSFPVNIVNSKFYIRKFLFRYQIYIYIYIYIVWTWLRGSELVVRQWPFEVAVWNLLKFILSYYIQDNHDTPSAQSYPPKQDGHGRNIYIYDYILYIYNIYIYI